MNNTYHNPNVDLYDIDFDLNNRWEKLLYEAHEGRFDIEDYYALCADTHLFIEKYDKCYMIPKTSIVLMRLMREFSNSDWMLEERKDFFYSTNYAGSLVSILIDGITEEDSTDNYDIDYELCERWDGLLEDIREKREFDLKIFQDLAVDTFKFLKEYDQKKMIPHATLKLHSLITRHIINSYSYLKGNKEAYAAQRISTAFEWYMVEGLRCKVNEDMHPMLIVTDDYIDTLNFDLTELVKNCPDWVTEKKD